eukprot:6175137-Prymnesium_polylepis.3
MSSSLQETRAGVDTGWDDEHGRSRCTQLLIHAQYTQLIAPSPTQHCLDCDAHPIVCGSTERPLLTAAVTVYLLISSTHPANARE